MLTATLSLILMSSLQLPQHVATTPVSRMGEKWWADRHAAKVAETQKGGIEVCFIGDSITHGWEGQRAWDRDFGPFKPGNFGFSGDRTEHVLWRLENGEMTGLNPKAFVIMIGTNNVGHGSSNPQQTADGVMAIVAKLRSTFPKAKVLLLGIFPRGLEANDRLRRTTAEATELFKGAADEKHVFFRDIGRWFVRVDGTLRATLMPDHLHLNADGYEVWSKAMLPELKAILGG